MQTHSDEIEQAVLGCCLIEPELFATLNNYDDDYFYSTLAKRLFAILRELYQAGTLADKTIVLSKIKGDDQLVAFFVKCCENVISASNFEYYLKQLIEYKIRRDIKKIGILSATLDLDDLPTAIKTLTDEIEKVQPQKIERSQKQILDDIYAEFEDLKNRGNEMDSGFPTFDKLINGFKRKRLYVLGGLPGSGKTGLALYLAQRIAFVNNKKVLFFSLEMSLFEIVGRLVSILCNVPSWRLQKTWCMLKEDFVHLATTLGRLYKSNLMVYDGVWNIGSIIAKIKEVKPDIVFVDHLQFVQVSLGKYQKQHEALEGIVKNLKNIAKSENICLFAISHNKRGDTPGSSGSNVDYKGAAAIKEIADLGMMLIREKKTKETITITQGGQTELRIIKNRNGRDGKVQLLFDDDTLKYTERAFQEDCNA